MIVSESAASFDSDYFVGENKCFSRECVYGIFRMIVRTEYDRITSVFVVNGFFNYL